MHGRKNNNQNAFHGEKQNEALTVQGVLLTSSAHSKTLPKSQFTQKKQRMSASGYWNPIKSPCLFLLFFCEWQNRKRPLCHAKVSWNLSPEKQKRHSRHIRTEREFAITDTAVFVTKEQVCFLVQNCSCFFIRVWSLLTIIVRIFSVNENRLPFLFVSSPTQPVPACGGTWVGRGENSMSTCQEKKNCICKEKKRAEVK